MALNHFKDDPVDVGTSASNVATIPAGECLTVQNIHVANRDTTDKKVSLSISATSATEDLTKSLLDNVVIPANDFIELAAGMKIGNAAARYIVGIAETASTITVKVSGTMDTAG